VKLVSVGCCGVCLCSAARVIIVKQDPLRGGAVCVCAAAGVVCGMWQGHVVDAACGI
jgi:hypothetical protein